MGCQSSAPLGPPPATTKSPPPPLLKPPPPLSRPSPAFQLSEFLLNNATSCALDLSNLRCSNTDLELNLIPALTPRRLLPPTTLLSPPSPTPTPHAMMLPGGGSSSLLSSPMGTPDSSKSASSGSVRLGSDRWMSLNLKNNALTPQSIDRLARCLVDNAPQSNLSALYLHGNQCQDEGVAYLCVALAGEQSKLKILGLNSNHITDRGARLLGDVLPKSKLEWLFLNSNPITDAGVAAVCAGVNASPLKVLGLSKTLLTATGVEQSVLPMCRQSWRLKQVHLSEADDGDEEVKRVLEVRNSAWAMTRLALAAVRGAPRVGRRSALRALDDEVIRRIADLLPYSPAPPRAMEQPAPC